MTLCWKLFCRAAILMICLSSYGLAPLHLYAQQRQTFPFGDCQPNLRFDPTPPAGMRVLRPGSILLCRLREELTSRNAKPGKRIVAYVSTAIADERGALLVPRNSRIIGQVDRVHRARTGKPAMLEIGFNTMQRCLFRNAHPKLMEAKENDEDCYTDFVQLGGTMIPLTQENCGDINEDGLLVGKKHGKGNTLKFAGAGAGGGALLGGLAVGTLTGTGIGAGIGAGLGLVLALTSKGKDVKIQAGALFGVELTSPLPLRAQDQALNYPPPPRPKPPKKGGGNNGGGNGGGGGGNGGGGNGSGAIRKCTGLDQVAIIRSRTESLLATHTSYLNGRGFDPGDSFFVKGLNQLRKPIGEFARASSKNACKAAANNLYIQAEGVTSSLDRERNVPDRMPEKSVNRWNAILDLIIAVANGYGVAY